MKTIFGEMQKIWEGIQGIIERHKKRKHGVIAQTVLVIFIIGFLCLLGSSIPSVGNYLHKCLIKLIGKYPIFNNWISVLDKTVFNKMSVDSAIEASKSIGRGLFYVGTKSLLEAFICSLAANIINEIFGGMNNKVLLNCIGIGIGVLICTLIGNTDSTVKKGLAYSIMNIILLLVGIFIMLKPSIFSNKYRKTDVTEEKWRLTIKSQVPERRKTKKIS